MGDFTTDELKELYHTIGLGALKFFLLRVDPKENDIQPQESIDFHGFTAPFIQFNCQDPFDPKGKSIGWIRIPDMPGLFPLEKKN